MRPLQFHDLDLLFFERCGLRVTVRHCNGSGWSMASGGSGQSFGTNVFHNNGGTGDSASTGLRYLGGMVARGKAEAVGGLLGV
jgi:hypothetical protein